MTARPRAGAIGVGIAATLSGLALLGLTAAGCGRYGPPMRTQTAEAAVPEASGTGARPSDEQPGRERGNEAGREQ